MRNACKEETGGRDNVLTCNHGGPYLFGTRIVLENPAVLFCPAKAKSSNDIFVLSYEQM